MKILVVIPAHNEQARIGQVIDDLHDYHFRDLLVVDDGSIDQTSTIARKKGARVICHVINRGLGAGLGTGFEYAQKNGYDCLVTFDADGQHRAGDLAALLEPVIQKKADVVIGSRLLQPEGIPLGRFLVNHVSNLATFALYRVWTTDTLSGLRAFNKKAISKIQIKTDRMEVSNEFFMEIRRNRLRLKEIPIKPVYTDYSEAHSHNEVSLGHSISIGKAMLLRLFR